MFCTFAGKHKRRSLFFIKLQASNLQTPKEAPAQMFYYRLCEVSFIEHLLTIDSNSSNLQQQQ